jgi:hypothetical protein
VRLIRLRVRGASEKEGFVERSLKRRRSEKGNKGVTKDRLKRVWAVGVLGVEGEEEVGEKVQQVMERRRGQGVCAKGREEEVLLRVGGSQIVQRSPLTALETLSAK